MAQSICKFVEGTNIMYEYPIKDLQNEESKEKIKKVQFREFTAPMKSVSVSNGNNLYVIGGLTRDKHPSKEIWGY